MSARYHAPLSMDGTWLLVVLVKTAVGLQPMCVVIQLAMNRARQVSAVLSLKAILLT